ncbi:hypothetical protein OIU85_017939 [Salix viminalis]|uniref:Uncharacterized protein n=1 Tax=Salix viminalis TaxID=40686 RepID=A0A9Q0USM6_SALVM|nr:hypothetical protein OIU85_017939 [Salix viminalis]
MVVRLISFFFSRNFFGKRRKSNGNPVVEQKGRRPPREKKRVGPLNMPRLYTSPLFSSPSLSSRRVGGKLWRFRKDKTTLLLLYFEFF